jgi:CelD/BcsL family acetyltransferase involved in cellulose biosynthesis
LIDPNAFDPAKPPVANVDPPAAEVPAGFDVMIHRHQILESPIPVIRRFPTLISYAPRQLLHFYTDLRGGSDCAFKQMSSKSRSTITRKVRSYREFSGGDIRWTIYKTPDELQTFTRLALSVARKTYQERLFGAGLPDTKEFHRDMMELARRDSVRAFLLFHGDKPIAYLYLPALDDILIYDYLGYDPEYIEHSPGTVLQYLALESLYAEQRFRLYYWGFGYSQTKKIFSSGHVLAADVYYFKPTLRNSFALHLHYRMDRFSEAVGQRLERLKLKETLKRWLKKQ